MIDSLLSSVYDMGRDNPLNALYLIGLFSFLLFATLMDIYDVIKKKIKIIRKKKMFNLLNKGKDVALSATIKKLLNMKIEKYGAVHLLELDSNQKTMKIEVLLKGEQEILEAKVHKYSIEERDEKYFLVLHDVETSREWINLVIEDYLNKEEFELPEKYVSMIKAVI